jgi:hypothetical protein
VGRELWPGFFLADSRLRGARLDSTVGDYAANVAAQRVYGQSAPFSCTPPIDPTAPPSAFFMLNFTGINPPLLYSGAPEALSALAALGALALLRRRYAREQIIGLQSR